MNESCGLLFDTHDEACSYCFEQYVTACGANSPAEAAEFLAEVGDEDIFAMMRAEGWTWPNEFTEWWDVDDAFRAMKRIRVKYILPEEGNDI